MITYSNINLQPYLNSSGTTYNSDRTSGALNAWGNSFPAEELPLGSTVTVADVPFHLPEKEGAYDHVETLGQVITLREVTPALGIALLCCGEMGNQELKIEVHDLSCVRHNLVAVAKAWLVPANLPDDYDGYFCSHLHYVGDYELHLLRPVLWSFRHEWVTAFSISSLLLGCNPLFHVFAMTLLHESERRG